MRQYLDCGRGNFDCTSSGGLTKAAQRRVSPGERLLFVTQPDWRYERGKLVAIFLFGVFWSMIALTFFGISVGTLLGLVPVKDASQAMGAPLA